MNRMQTEYIEVSVAPGVVQDVRIRNPAEENIQVEDFLLLIDENTKKFVIDRIKQQYTDAEMCDYPIWPQFLTVMYMKLSKIKYLTVLYKKLKSNCLSLAQRLGFVDKKGKTSMMSYQNLWLFAKKRLDPNTIDELSDYVLQKINERMKLYGIEFCNNVAHDGIAIRSHDPGAKYNDHYGFTMYKGEMGVDTDHLIPISFEGAEGTDYDGHYVLPFAEKLDRIDKKPRNGTFDGHYTSLENFAVLNQRHKMRTVMNIPESQRNIVKEGNVREITKVYQKFHKDEHFVVNADIDYKLSFLLNRGRLDEVGYYHRNHYIREWKKGKKKYMKEYHHRSLDETQNNMVKNGLVDVENGSNGTGLRNRDQHGKLCILVMQLVVLIRLQHGVTKHLTSVGNIAC